MITMIRMITIMVMDDPKYLDFDDWADEDGELGRDREKIPPRGDGDDGLDLKISSASV